MYEKAFESLGSFPIIQAAIAVFIIIVGYYVLIPRGEKDGKAAQRDLGSIPQWLLMGPVHDAMGAIHDIAEQGRIRNGILERIEDLAADIAKEQREQTQLLEMIRNESRLR
jgi:hypothetical protein